MARVWYLVCLLTCLVLFVEYFMKKRRKQNAFEEYVIYLPPTKLIL